MFGAVAGYLAALLCILRANDDRLPDREAVTYLVCGFGLIIAGTWPLIRWVMNWAI